MSWRSFVIIGLLSLPSLFVSSNPVRADSTFIPQKNSLAVGGEFTCLIKHDGTIHCLGNNTVGQLGNGSTSNQPVFKPTPVVIIDDKKPVFITAGLSHACSLYEDGFAACWGGNASGQLGNGTFMDSAKPVWVVGLGPVSRISAGWEATCAVTILGEVYCWGRGPVVQKKLEVNMKAPDAIGLSGIQDVGVGKNFACALTNSGEVQCWGQSTSGVLGPQGGDFKFSKIPGLTNVKSIAVGEQHACALLADTTVRCWGNNWAGQLGNLTTAPSNIPVHVLPNLDKVKKVFAGRANTCVIRDNDYLYCWGRNTDGQVGTETQANILQAKSMSGFKIVTEAGIGLFHTCAIQQGLLTCQGSDNYGQLGIDPKSKKLKSNGADVFSPTPGIVHSLTSNCAANQEWSETYNTCVIKQRPAFKTLATGSDFTCSLSGGKISCFGKNDFGQLGPGITGNNMPAGQSPKTVDLGTKAPVSLAAGGAHACALLSDLGIKCWGKNDQGQLGNSGMSGVAVTNGGNHSCAIAFNGDLWCWGANAAGQLGSGDTQATNNPKKVVGLTVKDTAAGNVHTCALKEDGSVSCWGRNNEGQLGNNSIKPSLTPIATAALGMPAEQIVAGDAHTCALLRNGTMKCWGDNSKGQLGIGTYQNSLGPIAVKNVADIASISAGQMHTCALLKNGTAYCWGDNSVGQLGDGAGKSSNLPIKVRSDGITQIAAGNTHTCALYKGGAMKCWGKGDAGQLGISPTSSEMSKCQNTACVKTPTNPTLKPQVPDNAAQVISKMTDLHHQIVATAPVAKKFTNQFQKVTRETLESQVADLFADKKVESCLYPLAKQSKNDSETANNKLKNLLTELNTQLTSLVPADSGASGYATNINDTYVQAAGIYLSALVSMAYDWPEQVSKCSTSLIEKENLLGYLTNFSTNPQAAGSIASSFPGDLQCLSPEVAGHLNRSLYTAFTAVTQIVENNRPAYAQAVRDGLLAKLAPLLFPLAEKTRPNFPQDASLALLQQYVERLGKVPAKQKVNEYGVSMEVPFLHLYNPVAKKTEQLSFCAGWPEQELYYKMGYTKYIGAPFSITDVLPKPESGDGEKTAFGVLKTQATAIASKSWPVWSGKTDNIYQGCLIFKNYANMTVNPVLLGDGTCSDWETFRIGKGCGLKPLKTSWMKNVLEMLIPSAFGQDARMPERGMPAETENDRLEIPDERGREPDLTTEERRHAPAEEIERANEVLQAREKARTAGPETFREHLLQNAPLILRGTPVEQKIEASNQGLRHTFYTVTVDEILRGSWDEPTLTITVPGGCLTPDDCETVVGLRTPKLNEPSLFILNPLANNLWSPIELSESVSPIKNERVPEWNLDLSVIRERSRASQPRPTEETR